MSVLLNASPFRDKFRSNVRRHLTSISDHSFSLAIANHREPVFTLLSVFIAENLITHASTVYLQEKL